MAEQWAISSERLRVPLAARAAGTLAVTAARSVQLSIEEVIKSSVRSSRSSTNSPHEPSAHDVCFHRRAFYTYVSIVQEMAQRLVERLSASATDPRIHTAECRLNRALGREQATAVVEVLPKFVRAMHITLRTETGVEDLRSA